MENSDKMELIVKPVEEPNNILYHDSSFDIIDSLIKLENYNVLMISLLKDGNKLCEVSGPELRHYLEPIINYSMVKDSFYYSRLQYDDSNVLFVTRFYSSPIANIYNFNTKSCIRLEYSNYAFMINLVDEQALVTFRGDKQDFIEDSEQLCTMIMVDYDGKLLKEGKIKFSAIARIYNYYDSNLLDSIKKADLLEVVHCVQ